MKSPLIRVYAEQDRESVLALWRVSFPDDPPWNEPGAFLDQKLSVQPEFVLVAELDGEVVGAIMGGYDGVRGWMYHLATSPEQRRKGIAGALVSDLEGRLVALGCTKVNLQVREGNTEVSGFYRAMGYAEEPRISFGRRLEPQSTQRKPVGGQFAVIFSSEMAKVSAEYSQAAEKMEELARTIPGYLGIESYREGTRAISVSYWQSEEAIARWRAHSSHVEVQARGRQDWYERYTMRVARVVREGQLNEGAGVPL